jgi:hypothetical protein
MSPIRKKDEQPWRKEKGGNPGEYDSEKAKEEENFAKDMVGIVKYS